MTEQEKVRFGTVGAPQTTPESGTVAAVQHSYQLGLRHLEIAWTRSVRISDESCQEISTAAAAYDGFTLSVHAPYYINLNSQTADKMAASDERLLTAARKGYLAGATDIVFHPGSYHKQPAEQVYERIREKLEELTDILREEGTHVTLRPETMGKSNVFGSLDEVLQLSKDVDVVLPCIDWAHLHARTGDGSFNTYEDFTDALERVRDALGDDGLNTLHSHMSGIAYTPKGEKEHIPLNEADLNYRDLLQAFIDYDVQGSIAVEAPRPFHTADCLLLQATYRRLVDLHEPAKAAESAD